MLKPLTKPPSRLRRLEGALLDLPEEAMLLSDLDGFLAGLLVCREPVDQAEWLPYVWGSVPGQELDAPFEEADDLRWFTGMVVAYRDEIARMMDRGRYQPLLDVDPRNGDLLWEIWIEGFGTAMTLRPDSWDGVAGDAGHAVPPGIADAAGAALAGLSTLIAIADDASDLAHAEIDAIADRAPELIAMWIGQLYAARAPRPAGSAQLVTGEAVTGSAVAGGAVGGSAAASAVRPGRNDACPCGSGRKWKKCCGLA